MENLDQEFFDQARRFASGKDYPTADDLRKIVEHAIPRATGGMRHALLIADAALQQAGLAGVQSVTLASLVEAVRFAMCVTDENEGFLGQAYASLTSMRLPVPDTRTGRQGLLSCLESLAQELSTPREIEPDLEGQKVPIEPHGLLHMVLQFTLGVQGRLTMVEREKRAEHR